VACETLERRASLRLLFRHGGVIDMANRKNFELRVDPQDRPTLHEPPEPAARPKKTEKTRPGPRKAGGRGKPPGKKFIKDNRN
jgi:hypothetical protein